MRSVESDTASSRVTEVRFGSFKPLSLPRQVSVHRVTTFRARFWAFCWNGVCALYAEYGCTGFWGESLCPGGELCYHDDYDWLAGWRGLCLSDCQTAQCTGRCDREWGRLCVPDDDSCAASCDGFGCTREGDD